MQPQITEGDLLPHNLIESRSLHSSIPQLLEGTIGLHAPVLARVADEKLLDDRIQAIGENLASTAYTIDIAITF